MMLAKAAIDLHWLDMVVVAVYLIGITVLGAWMGRRISNSAEYFMPRKFGKGMMIMHAFGTGTASDQAVVVSSATFAKGLSGIWYQWLWLFVTPFYWLIAPIFRRFRATTTADVYELRFDHSVAVLFALVGMANMCIKIGLMLKGAGALIDSGTGGAIDAEIAIVAVTVLFVVYGVAGGLGAAIVTDYIQGMLTILFSILLLPFILYAVGGMSGVHQTIADPAMMSLVVPGEITLFFVAMVSLQALIGIVAQPFIMGVCAAGKTEWEGRVGIVVGNLVKRLCTIAWCLTGIAAVAWYIQQGNDPANMDAATLKATADGIYGEVANAFLPAVMPGLLGLFLAALLAGVMSSCDSFMISSAGLFTENIYRQASPDRSESHYIWVGRMASILVVIGGVLFAFWVPSVVKALSIWFKIAPMMGLVFWIGLIWRRMTVAGAWATTLTGFATWWITTQNWFLNWISGQPFSDSLGLIHSSGEAMEMVEPWQILFYLISAVAMGIFVSLATRPVANEKLDLFYQLTRTPVAAGEVISSPCTLPESTPPAQRRQVANRFGLELPVPSQVSVIGFLAVWFSVAALIGGFVWIVA